MRVAAPEHSNEANQHTGSALGPIGGAGLHHAMAMPRHVLGADSAALGSAAIPSQRERSGPLNGFGPHSDRGLPPAVPAVTHGEPESHSREHAPPPAAAKSKTRTDASKLRFFELIMGAPRISTANTHAHPLALRGAGRARHVHAHRRGAIHACARAPTLVLMVGLGRQSWTRIPANS
jgi:hypothetical protein